MASRRRAVAFAKRRAAESEPEWADDVVAPAPRPKGPSKLLNQPIAAASFSYGSTSTKSAGSKAAGGGGPKAKFNDVGGFDRRVTPISRKYGGGRAAKEGRPAVKKATRAPTKPRKPVTIAAPTALPPTPTRSTSRRSTRGSLAASGPPDDSQFSDDELAITATTIATPTKTRKIVRVEIPPTPPSTHHKRRKVAVSSNAAEESSSMPRKSAAAGKQVSLPLTPAKTPTKGKGKAVGDNPFSGADGELDSAAQDPRSTRSSSLSPLSEDEDDVDEMNLEHAPQHLNFSSQRAYSPSSSASVLASEAEIEDYDQACISAADAASIMPDSEDESLSQVDPQTDVDDDGSMEVEASLMSPVGATPSTPPDSAALSTSTINESKRRRETGKTFQTSVALPLLHSLLPVLSRARPLPVVVPSSSHPEESGPATSLTFKRDLMNATPCLLGLETAEQDLRSVLARTVWEGEGNAMVMIGGRGSGKSAVRPVS